MQHNLKERIIGNQIDNFSEFSNTQWNNFNFKLVGGESLNQVQKLISIAYKKILEQDESNIIICGHSTSLSVLFNHILDGEYGVKELKKMKMPDIYIAKYENNKLLKFKQIY